MLYVAEEEVSSSLAAAIGGASTEQAVRVVYVPQAVFRVRAVTRCTSTLPGHASPIVSAQFAPGGKLLATGAGDHTVRLWDVLTETPKATLRAHSDWVLAIAWSPCGRYLLSGGKDGTVAVWATSDLAAPQRTIRAHKKFINALAWEPLHRGDAAGACVASRRRPDGTVAGERATGRPVLTRRGTPTRCRAGWGGDGLLFTGSHDRTVKVGGVEEARAHPRRPRPLGELLALDGRRAAHRRARPPRRRPPTRRRRRRRRRRVRRAARPRRRRAPRLRLRRLHAFPAPARRTVARLTGHVQLVNCVAFSPDAQLLASGSFDGAVRLWAARTGKFVATLRGHVGAVYQVSWSGDARLIASGSKDSTLKVWDARTRKLREDLPGHADEVYAVDWSPDGRHVASGGKDRNLKMCA